MLAGVPARVAVPSPLSTKVTPEGRAPDSVIAAFGVPVVVTVNVPAAPAVKEVALALVIAGAPATVTVSVWMAVPYPLAAERAIGYVPGALGVPDKRAVPSPLSTKVIPGGTFDQLNLGAG